MEPWMSAALARPVPFHVFPVSTSSHQPRVVAAELRECWTMREPTQSMTRGDGSGPRRSVEPWWEQSPADAGGCRRLDHPAAAHPRSDQTGSHRPSRLAGSGRGHTGRSAQSEGTASASATVRGHSVIWGETVYGRALPAPAGTIAYPAQGMIPPTATRGQAPSRDGPPQPPTR